MSEKYNDKKSYSLFEQSEVEEKYPPIKCTTAWSVEDVHNEREHQGYSKWTDQQAYDWLTSRIVNKTFHEMCLDSGWMVMNTLLMEEREEE